MIVGIAGSEFLPMPGSSSTAAGLLKLFFFPILRKAENLQTACL